MFFKSTHLLQRYIKINISWDIYANHYIKKDLIWPLVELQVGNEENIIKKEEQSIMWNSEW